MQPEETEWRTRKARIDQRLRALSPAWQIVRYHPGLDLSRLTCHVVEEIPTDSGPADYGFFVNGLFLGILEAKRVRTNPQNVLEQAKRYSRGATHGPGNWSGYRVPFLFATNGELIWFIDIRHDQAASRQLADFHVGPALAALFAFDPKRVCDEFVTTAGGHAVSWV